MKDLIYNESLPASPGNAKEPIKLHHSLCADPKPAIAKVDIRAAYRLAFDYNGCGGSGLSLVEGFFPMSARRYCGRCRAYIGGASTGIRDCYRQRESPGSISFETVSANPAGDGRLSDNRRLLWTVGAFSRS